MLRNRSASNPFKKLTWRDLEDWAGSKIISRGKSYHKSRAVQDLARKPNGALVAWVQGSKRYATEVACEAGKLVSNCTCPYGATCKHAVAVVLEYLERLKNNIRVPAVATNDRRFELLENGVGEQAWDEEYDEILGQCGSEEKLKTFDASSFLEKQTKAQLISLIKDLAQRYSSVSEDLQDRQNVSEGNIKQLVRSIQMEIRELTSEPGWTNRGETEGSISDYSRLRKRLQGLLDQGHADAVVALGKELLERGTQQASMSHDEGETSCAIASCMEVIFKALAQSSVPPVEKLLWAVDAELQDEYELCHGAEIFWKQKHSPAAWNDLAEKLMERLNNFQHTTTEDCFSQKYHRDRLSDWVIHALDKAGRKKEIIPLCEQEAEKTESYQRLVNFLVRAQRFKEAEQWIFKGINATLKKSPGIAAGLRETLRELRKKNGDWLYVASLCAEDFFQHPGLDSFQTLQKAAEKAQALSAVRAAAVHFLEAGKLPYNSPSWPLFRTGTIDTDKRCGNTYPLTKTLVDIAIAEKRLEDVIRWYDVKNTTKEFGWWGNESWEDRVAVALADSYPERSIAIWKKVAETQIGLTQPKYYAVAARYLRKINRLMIKLGRAKDWQAYVSDLRIAHAKKKRFIEILDGLTGRPIVKG